MIGFSLSGDYITDSEALLRKSWSRTTSSSATPPTNKPITPAPSATSLMAKSLHDYSIPSVANVPVGPVVNIGAENFELWTGLIRTVQANQFCGLPSEDANAHLQHFLELCNTIAIKDVAPDTIRLRLFPFSLAGKAKQWFYQDQEVVNTWNKCSTAFLTKFFPLGKTNVLRGRITNF